MSKPRRLAGLSSRTVRLAIPPMFSTVPAVGAPRAERAPSRRVGVKRSAFAAGGDVAGAEVGDDGEAGGPRR